MESADSGRELLHTWVACARVRAREQNRELNAPSSDIAYRLATGTVINPYCPRNASLSVVRRVSLRNYIITIFLLKCTFCTRIFIGVPRLGMFAWVQSTGTHNNHYVRFPVSEREREKFERNKKCNQAQIYDWPEWSPLITNHQPASSTEQPLFVLTMLAVLDM